MPDREKVISELEVIKYFFRQCRERFLLGSDEENSLFDLQEAASEAISLLKEQEAKQHISDAIHETAKQFRRQIVMCKDCKYKECEGRDGLIVCDITGESHNPDWFCADGERHERR